VRRTHRPQCIEPTAFTATATATGGRNGHTESDDGLVKADLSVPKVMGEPGKPGTATPEHLFAAGYAACFGGALDYVAKQHKKNAASARITCAVSIGPRDGGGFGLAVQIRVEDQSVPQAEWRPSRKKPMRRSAPTRTPQATTSALHSRSWVGERRARLNSLPVAPNGFLQTQSLARDRFTHTTGDSPCA
jgi:Ohr subfamily peroxiredoxin